MATAAAIEFTDLIDFAVISSCSLFGPVYTDTTYGDITYQQCGTSREMLSQAYKDKNGYFRLETGTCQSTRTHLGPFFSKNANGEYNLSYDVCRDRKREFLLT